MVSWEEVGKRIDRALRENGQSQAALAAELGCHPSSVSRMVTGERKVDSVELAQVAEFVGRPMWWFLEERPAMEEVLARATESTTDADVRRAITLFEELLSEYRWLRGLEV